MQTSHRSMQNDYEITVPEIDYLVTIISETIGKEGGARMTGGGFGGCVVALLPKDLIQSVTAAIVDRYEAKTYLSPNIYICEPTSGVHSL